LHFVTRAWGFGQSVEHLDELPIDYFRQAPITVPVPNAARRW